MEESRTQMGTFPIYSNAMVQKLSAAALRATTQTAVVDGTQHIRVLIGPYQKLSKAEAQLVNLNGSPFTEEVPFIQRVK